VYCYDQSSCASQQSRHDSNKKLELRISNTCDPALVLGKFIDIIPRMPSVQSRFTRTLALLLPCCLAWSIVACLWLYSHHPGEENENSAYHQTEAINIHGDSDPCPIKVTPGLIPDKQSTNSRGAETLAQSLILPLHYGHAPHSVARVRLPLSTADPPLERLCVCRV
jgi:hypothetical protein